MRSARKKLYRSFPELDRFPDSACDLMVSRMEASRSFTLPLMLSITFIVLGVFGCGMALWLIVQESWTAFEKDLFDRYGRPMSDVLGLGLAYAPMLIASGLAGLLARDALSKILLRRAIARRIRSTRCTNCHVSLLGLPTIGNTVRCPACDRVMGLSELDLSSPVELLSPPAEYSRQAESDWKEASAGLSQNGA